jgi:hypothetical protein
MRLPTSWTPYRAPAYRYKRYTKKDGDTKHPAVALGLQNKLWDASPQSHRATAADITTSGTVLDSANPDPVLQQMRWSRGVVGYHVSLTH